MFKSATTEPEAPIAKPKKQAAPVGKETVSIAIDRDVLTHFQDAGVGWRERINAALRKASGLS